MHAWRRSSSLPLSIFVLMFLVLTGESGIYGFPHESTKKENDKPQHLVFIREMHMSLEQRSTEPLPEHLPLEMTSKDGVYKVVLERNRAVDPANIPVVVKKNGKLEEMEPISGIHGFYIDQESNAVIHVQVVKDAGQVKRHYRGTLRLGSKTYELHPMEVTDKLRRDIKENHDIDTENLHIHALKSTNMNHYRDAHNIIKKSRADRGNRSAYDKFLRDIDKMATEERKRGAGNSGSSGNNNNEGTLSGGIDHNVKAPHRTDVDIPTDNNGKEAKDKLQGSNKIWSLLDLLLGEEIEQGGHKRHKRDVSANTELNYQYAMEMVIVVANDMVQTFDDDTALITYILHIFNWIHMAYERINKAQDTFGIRIILKEIYLAKTLADDFIGDAVTNSYGDINPVIVGENIYKFLRSPYPKYYWSETDHVFYITNKWLSVWSEEIGEFITAIGNAPTGSGCDPFYGYSIVTNLGLTSGLTAAHELAHALNGNHDGYNGCPDVGNIMSASEISVDESNVNNAFDFSPCTIREIRGFLAGMIDGYGQNCFVDDPCDGTVQGVGRLSKPPGKVYDLHQQCQMYFNNQNAYYSADCNTDNDICKHLSCYVPGIGCSSTTEPTLKEVKAFMGTKCEGDRTKWCMLGKCEQKSLAKYESMQHHCIKKRSYNSIPSNCLESSVYDEECDLQDNPEGDFAHCYTPEQAALPYDVYWCHKQAIDRPYVFYDYQNAVTLCRKNVCKFGLHFRFNNPCFSDGYDYVYCSETGTSFVQYTELCDGTEHCPNGEDEQDAFCKSMSYKIPYCYDNEAVHCPQNFGNCVHPTRGCDGVSDCANGEDEDTGWCENIPAAICEPGKTNTVANPSICA